MNRVGTTLSYRVTIWLTLYGGALLMLVPFLWLISSALKEPKYLWLFPQLIPNPMRYQNFVEALTILPFDIYLRNTVLIVVVRAFEMVLASSFCAYGFAKVRFFGRDVLFILILSTLMIPEAVLMVPHYVMFRTVGWLDTFLPFIIPPLLGGSAFYVFLLRQFFRTVPNELTDAAKIDGCSHLGVYWRIMMPLARPALATVAVFTFLGSWNDFMHPLIYLVSPEKFTVALGLHQFRGMYSTEWHLLMAASTVMILPVIFVFFLGQRYFIEGAMISGLKG